LAVATLSPLGKEKGLSIAAKPFYKLVEAAGLEPASRKPTFIVVDNKNNDLYKKQ
jgi:hypothetical protein